MKNLLSKLRETMPLPLKNQGEFCHFSLRQRMFLTWYPWVLFLQKLKQVFFFYTSNRRHWAYSCLSSRRQENENSVSGECSFALRGSWETLWCHSTHLHGPYQSRAFIHCIRCEKHYTMCGKHKRTEDLALAFKKFTAKWKRLKNTSKGRSLPSTCCVLPKQSNNSN